MKPLMTGANFAKLETLLKKTVMERLRRLEKKGEKKESLEFIITEEIVDTVGIFTLRSFFGEPNIDAWAETVTIYGDAGDKQTLSFSMAFRTVWR